MMVFLRALLPLLLFALAGHAGAQGVLVDKSDIRFVSKQMGADDRADFHDSANLSEFRS